MSDTVNETKKNTDDILTLLRGGVADPTSGMVGVQTDLLTRIAAVEATINTTRSGIFQIVMRALPWILAACLAFLGIEKRL